MSWIRRSLGIDDPHTAPEPQADDTPEALRETLAEVVRTINASAGQLSAAAVVQARRLTDTVMEIIDTSSIRPLDVYAVINVKGTLHDYLPTTLRRYLALPEAARGPGSPATVSLLEQIGALQTSASSVLVAARDQDVDALMTQGAFLRTKFSGSDLDL